MCGIAGWVSYDRDLTAHQDIITAMTGTMARRGPDAGGVWIDRHAGLGHRRLAVIDLAGGVQPMQAEEAGRTIVSLTYSGEVYNFVELRDELTQLGHQFKTRSDTEVVLRGYLQWGDRVAERLNGMFAFAIWDVRTEELFLIRDRMGVKPLYYYPTADGVLFGSEPKAMAHRAIAVHQRGRIRSFSVDFANYGAAFVGSRWWSLNGLPPPCGQPGHKFSNPQSGFR